MCAVCGCNSENRHEHDHSHGHAHAHLEHDHDHHHPAPAPPSRTVQLQRDVLAKNDAIAQENRAWLDERRIVALNLTSSPGSGKTTLLEKLIGRLRGDLPIAVIEGDQETERDAERIRKTGSRVVQINTGAGCHLDGEMVRRAIGAIEPRPDSLLFIENVGNLVCPALFDLGERAMVLVMSITEGEDKPLKYPHMFRAADAIVVSKIDLLPYVEFDLELCLGHIAAVNPDARVFLVSAKQEQGLEDLCGWIDSLVRTPA